MKRSWWLFGIAAVILLAVGLGVFAYQHARSSAHIDVLKITMPKSVPHTSNATPEFCGAVSDIHGVDTVEGLLWIQAEMSAPPSVHHDVTNLYQQVQRGKGNAATVAALQKEGKLVCGNGS